MSWYKQSQIRDFVKTSFKQENTEETFGDYQRYVCDAYDVKTYYTTLSNRIAIAINIYNMTTGGCQYQQFWTYSSKEGSRAKATYKEINDKIKEVVAHYTEIEEYSPNSMIVSTLKAATWEIDRAGRARSNIPWINYAIDKASYEEDWRQSIYGGRYPKNDSTGY
jgi:hypothetical protein